MKRLCRITKLSENLQDFLLRCLFVRLNMSGLDVAVSVGITTTSYENFVWQNVEVCLY